jgi:hypothetical protein
VTFTKKIKEVSVILHCKQNKIKQIDMKKLIVISIMLVMGLTAGAYTVEENNNVVCSSFASTDEADDMKNKVQSVRQELVMAGHSLTMINDLFGDENLFFPTNENKLVTVIYIVDLLIDNDQYTESDKSALVALANEAYIVYNGVSVKAKVAAQTE